MENEMRTKFLSVQSGLNKHRTLLLGRMYISAIG